MHPFSSPRTADGKSGEAPDAWLNALSCWYVSGLIAALGFSFGFCLVRPAWTFDRQQPDWLDRLTWMDGRWYKQIATEGYHYDPAKRSNVAFYPTYPLLGRSLIMATGLRPETALLIVSNASFLAALAVLALYVRSRAADRLAHPPAHSQRPLPPGDEAKTDLRKPPPAEIADWAVLAASLFPTGCFFRLTYSESTFLLAALLAMYSMTRRWPLWASALIVGLATATRPVGVAMLAPLAIHIFRRFALRGAALRLALYLPLACWGLAAFMAYQYRAFGDPIATVRTQQHWGVRRPIPWAEKAVALATLEPLRSVYDSQSSAYWASFDPHGVSWFSMQFANPLYFLAAIGLTALGAWRRWLSLEEISFSTLLLLIPYITRGYEMGMGSMGRFVAAGFPIYLVLAQLLVRLPAPLRAALLALSGFYLASYTALYGARYTIF